MSLPFARLFRWPAPFVIGAALLVAAAGAWPAAATQARAEASQAAAGLRARHDPARAGDHAGAAQAGDQAAAEEEHGESLWPLLFRLINFAVLVGTLVYFLRKPFATYLQNRAAEIRRDLVEAEELRQHAQMQLAAIDEKLQALPAAIDALRARGAEEIAAEEARIRAAAEVERERLLEHARREIALQVRVATQELMREAADLAVGVARERIKKDLSPETHLRLVDRYADQVKEARTFHD